MHFILSLYINDFQPWKKLFVKLNEWNLLDWQSFRHLNCFQAGLIMKTPENRGLLTYKTIKYLGYDLFFFSFNLIDQRIKRHIKTFFKRL